MCSGTYYTARSSFSNEVEGQVWVSVFFCFVLCWFFALAISISHSDIVCLRKPSFMSSILSFRTVSFFPTQLCLALPQFFFCLISSFSFLMYRNAPHFAFQLARTLQSLSCLHFKILIICTHLFSCFISFKYLHARLTFILFYFIQLSPTPPFLDYSFILFLNVQPLPHSLIHNPTHRLVDLFI
jgi:hypothetical protein